MEEEEVNVEDFWKEYYNIPLSTLLFKCSGIIPLFVCQHQGDGKHREIIYRCKTCGIDDTSCICSTCFSKGNHEGHDAYAYATAGTFTCDCGNERAWKRSGFCSEHGNQFKGNVVEQIPLEFKGIEIVLEKMINEIAIQSQKEMNSKVQKILIVINALTSCNLFFLLFADICNKNIPNFIHSSIKEKLNKKSISYFEYFFELCFTRGVGCENLKEFLTKYMTELHLFKFSPEIIYQLSIDSISGSFNNEKLVQDLTFHFTNSKDDYIKYYFKSNRLEHTLDLMCTLFTKIFCGKKILYEQEYCNSLKTTNLLSDNFNNFLFWFIVEHPKMPVVDFTDIIYNKFIQALSLCSNSLPILIKEGTHVEYDNYYFDSTSYVTENSIEIIEAIVDTASINSLFSHFPLIHSQVMKSVRKYLVNVPIINVEDEQIHLRLCGKNQPVSPLSPLLNFYCEVLLHLNKNNKKPEISNEDALLLIEHVILSQVFKEQYINGDWVRNGGEAEQQFYYYVSPYYFQPILLDLTLVQLLLSYVSPKQFFLTSFVMFNLLGINLSGIDLTKKYHLSDLQIESPYQVTGFIRSLIEISREQTITSNLSDSEIFQQMILHFTAAGISAPSLIVQQTPYDSLPLERNYDVVCEKKGIIKKKLLSQINPVYPLFGQIHRESLIKQTIFNNKSIKSNRFEFGFKDELVFDGIKQLLKSIWVYKFFVQLIQKLNTKNKNCICDSIELGMLFIHDGYHFHLFESNEFLKNEEFKEVVKAIGYFIGIHRNELPGSKEFVNEIKSYLLEGFSSVPEHAILQNDIEVKEKPKMKKQEMKKKILLLMKKKQELYHKSIEKITENKNDECVICQMDEQNPMGRLIFLSGNGGVEIQRANEGGKTFAPLNVTTCSHHVHLKCFEEMRNERSTCPVCVNNYSHFMPLSRSIIQNGKTKEFIKESFKSILEIEIEDGNSFDAITWCIHSTISSIELALRSGISMNEEDKDLIYSMFLAIQILSEEYESNKKFIIDKIDLVDPFFAYITLKAFKEPTEIVHKSQVRGALAVIASKEPKLLKGRILEKFSKKKLECVECSEFDNINTLQEAINKLCETYQTSINLLNKCINEKEEKINFLQYINEASNIYALTIPSISHPFEFKHLPKTILKLVNKYSIEKCCNCHETDGDVLTKKICLNCGCLVCNNCFTEHRIICTNGFGIYLDVSHGAVCLSEDDIEKGIVVYENKYGDNFTATTIQQSEFLLQNDKYQQFKNAFLRGSILQSSLFIEFSETNLEPIFANQLGEILSEEEPQILQTQNVDETEANNNENPNSSN
ncbi:RING finger domain containing protein [Entamoeba histolytica HM-1:IMSS-B]|uniref:E3 ubiquitin-protein ligase n=4 Tax=Entamoeba histolytica TaxID=5759 RepID=C4M418_ENTH1|nr:hypothetical protein EHI_114110 [Entamoeba histolytica HM-1:IMSS]EAL42745.1 hypothetical protein EHI_114110 [Entamoeba histolytica HM-1:IMSS]EMH75542.1 RING finger domain containing protein [Entamoeba histolytica HM-1:IMSS-B]ENY62819.1 ubiquitin ligase E3 alpha, putative [Entamoeba histolytica HM-1:IMSS-A]GAT96090.1 hypothetical protein CL6EHI_114110 [Entamoeba histolytica]|eukprot:XP_648130.1 hypothetical protein EHI_114110 [Entamoeba histolytica HM-1:IMSS]